MMYYDSFTQQWSKIELNLTLQLPPPEMLVPYTRSNMEVQLDQAFVSVLGSARTDRFLDKVNAGYDVIWGMVGGAKPYNGDKMGFRNVRTLPADVEGCSGQPIQWATANSTQHAAAMANSLGNFYSSFHVLDVQPK